MPGFNKNSGLIFSEISSPILPPNGRHTIFVKPDGKLYIIDSSGVETSLTGSITGFALQTTVDTISGSLQTQIDNIIASPNVSSSFEVSSISGSNIVYGSVADVSAMRFDADSGFDVIDLGNGAVKIQMNSTFKYWEVDGQDTLIASGLDTIKFVEGTGVQIATDINSDPKTITFSITGDYAANTHDITVHQISHGFSVGDAIRLDFDSQKYVLSQADTVENAEVFGLVINVIDSDNFKYRFSGFITGLTTPLSAGIVYYLDTENAGILTATSPVSGINKPLLYSLNENSGLILEMRGFVVTDEISGTGFLDLIDTPSVYTANQYLRVNPEGDGITFSEFTSPLYVSKSGDTINGGLTITDISGSSDGQIVTVLSDGTLQNSGLTIFDISGSGSSVDLSDYTLLTTTASISADLQGQIDSLNSNLPSISGTKITSNGSNVFTMELSGGIPTSLVPDVSGLYDLGSVDKPWRELYLTGNTIYLEGYPISIQGNRLTFQNSKTLAYTDELTSISNNLSTEIINAKNSTTIDIPQTSHGFSVGEVACLKEPVTYWGLYHIGSPIQTGDYTKTSYNSGGINYVTRLKPFYGNKNSSNHWCEWSDGSFDDTPSSGIAIPLQLHGSIATYEMPIFGASVNNIYRLQGEGLFLLSDKNGVGFNPDRLVGFLILNVGSNIRVFQRTVENGLWQFIGSQNNTQIAGSYEFGPWCVTSFTATSMRISDRYSTWSYNLTIPETDKVIYGFYTSRDNIYSEVLLAPKDSYSSVGFFDDENSTFWTKATTSDPTKARFGGIVSKVEDSNNFTITTGGYINTLSGLIPGKMYYLSGSAGGYTQFEPNVGKSIALFQAISATEATIGITSENKTDSYIDKSGDTMNGDLTISTLSGNPDKIVTLDSNGKLQASNFTVADISGSGSSVDLSDYTLLTTTASISADLQIQIDNIIIPDVSNFITTSEVSSISGGLDSRITLNGSDISSLQSNVTELSGAIDSINVISGNNITVVESPSRTFTVNLNDTQTGNKIFSNNVTINGNLYVNGTETIVNTQSVSAEDNQIVINAGETGNGVTAGFAGIRVDRGSELPYDFQFRESDDSFVIGIDGDYQAVATREDNPIDGGFAVWNASESRFDTTLDVAAASHTHSTSDISNLSSYTGFDARYYTETEVNTLLSSKSDTSHNHTLDSLSNVTITDNTNGEILRWNGTAWVNNTLAEAGIAGATVITADTTVYVATTGNDSNDGSVSSPWATLQHAMNVVSTYTIYKTATVTIQVQDGTYNISGTLNLGCPHGDRVVIKGNTTTPANVVLSITPATDGICILIQSRLSEMNGFTITQPASAGSSYLILVNRNGFVRFGANMVYNPDYATYALYLTVATVYINGGTWNMSVNGVATKFIWVVDGTLSLQSSTFNQNGVPLSWGWEIRATRSILSINACNFTNTAILAMGSNIEFVNFSGNTFSQPSSRTARFISCTVSGGFAWDLTHTSGNGSGAEGRLTYFKNCTGILNLTLSAVGTGWYGVVADVGSKLGIVGTMTLPSGVGIYSTENSSVLVNDASITFTGTTKYNPARTTSNTPTYGNNMGIIIEAPSTL